jgi:hypothetical protein
MSPKVTWGRRSKINKRSVGKDRDIKKLLKSGELGKNDYMKFNIKSSPLFLKECLKTSFNR